MKLLLALFAAMLAIGAVSFWFWRAAPAIAPCEERVLSEATSPDARFVAAAYQRRCAESVTTHVALRPAGSSFKPRGDVFVAAGLARVALRWPEERQLVVESPAERILVQETSWRSVAVRVVLVR
ncbi:MAG TPA: hypothetical protein VF993_15710 [Myxococcales bacterium]